MRTALLVVMLILGAVLAHRGYQAWDAHQQMQRKIDIAVRILSIPMDASGR